MCNCPFSRCTWDTLCPALGGSFHSQTHGAPSTATSWLWAGAALLPESRRWAIHADRVALVVAFLCGAPHPGLSIRLALQAPPAGGLPAAAPTAPRTPGGAGQASGRGGSVVAAAVACHWVEREYLHCIVTVFLHFPDVLDSTYCILIVHIALFMYLR